MAPGWNRVPARRMVSAFLLAVYLSGCAQWAPVTQPIPEAVEKNPKANVRLTLLDGKQVELNHLRLVSDSLFGLHLVTSSPSGVPEPWDQSDTVAVALADISRMEIEKGSGSAPGIVAGVVLLIGIVAVGVSQALENSDMGF